MTAKVTLWLEVAEGDVWIGPSALWTRDLRTDYAPGPGDRIVLWPDDDTPHDGPMWTVRGRYWDTDGNLHCELERMVINPGERAIDEMRQLATRGRLHAAPWYTHGTSPELPRGGWRPYLSQTDDVEVPE